MSDPYEAYTRYTITTHDDEFVTLHSETNDDLDYGYPTVYEQWTSEYKGEGALEKCLKHTGLSRQGIGHRVYVTVDGKEV